MDATRCNKKRLGSRRPPAALCSSGRDARQQPQQAATSRNKLQQPQQVAASRNNMPSLAIEAARTAWPPLAAAPPLIAARRGSRSACCGAVRPARVVPHGCGQLQFTKHFTELFKRFHGSGRGMASCCDSCGQLRLLRLAAACCGLLRSCCRLLRSCCCLLRLVEVLLRLVALR